MNVTVATAAAAAIIIIITTITKVGHVLCVHDLIPILCFLFVIPQEEE
jgi:hypothetical protein